MRTLVWAPRVRGKETEEVRRGFYKRTTSLCLAFFMMPSRHSYVFVEGPNDVLTSQGTVPGALVGI